MVHAPATTERAHGVRHRWSRQRRVRGPQLPGKIEAFLLQVGSNHKPALSPYELTGQLTHKAHTENGHDIANRDLRDPNRGHEMTTGRDVFRVAAPFPAIRDAHADVEIGDRRMAVDNLASARIAKHAVIAEPGRH